MITRNRLATALLPVLIAFGSAHAQEVHSATDAPPPKQVYCPITPEEEIDSEVFTEYEGRRVYFCCERCRARFLRDPGRYATRLISTAAPVQKQPVTPEPLAHDHESARSPSPITGHTHREEPQGGGEHGHESHVHAHTSGWVNWIGRFHPAMVPFPIGVVVAGALAEILFLLTRRSSYGQAALFCVRFGGLTGALAGFLGWCFGGFHIFDADWLLAVHRWLGTTTVVCLVALLWANEMAHHDPPRHVSLYRALLFVAAALVLVTGFFGGSMVYGIDHYVRP